MFTDREEVPDDATDTVSMMSTLRRPQLPTTSRHLCPYLCPIQFYSISNEKGRKSMKRIILEETSDDRKLVENLRTFSTPVVKNGQTTEREHLQT